MKRIFLLLGAGFLSAGLAFAQDMPSSSTENPSQEQGTNQTYRYENSSMVRGCLSGSVGNYTLTDQNGVQYTVVGGDSGLQSKVGHEVEITTKQNESSQVSTQENGTTTRTTNSIQVADVRDISASCNVGSSVTTPSQPDNGMNPKGTPESDKPPEPKMIAMLQQSAAGTAQQSTGSPAQQTSPPVSSQTPAAPSSPTGANSQVGNSPANNSGMTESEANHDAQAARQGELNANPQNGQTTGRGVNNQGVNNPSSTSPNAVPTSPNSASPSSNTQQPQTNANDQNKPLYERQATHIPWANQPGGNTNTPPPPH